MIAEGVMARLAAAGFELPAPPQAVGNYAPAVASGKLVFTSGQLPMRVGQLLASGLVGSEVDEEVAAVCAAQCALNALAAAATVCDLDAVIRVVKLVGYVASAPGFTRQPAVIDHASALMLTAFGEPGRHAREAVGVAALPLGAPIELSVVLEMA
jgi:enamine deaminase RidA (YjgF/YER057c/UK114 family)